MLAFVQSVAAWVNGAATASKTTATNLRARAPGRNRLCKFIQVKIVEDAFCSLTSDFFGSLRWLPNPPIKRFFGNKPAAARVVTQECRLFNFMRISLPNLTHFPYLIRL